MTYYYKFIIFLAHNFSAGDVTTIACIYCMGLDVLKSSRIYLYSKVAGKKARAYP
jgi:hypothetical protein